MKLGFYDSGLGGLSVLKEFIAKYDSKYSYVYFGDSARAPYGSKTKDELKTYIVEILDYMQEKEVDLVVSACNTTSMLLDELDLLEYDFPVLSLYELMNDFFNSNPAVTTANLALLATQSTIDSKKYLNWGLEIYPLACPTLVPLLEAGDLKTAKLEWNKYLDSLPENIDSVIVGCTHYSFFVDEERKFKYIDPAKIILDYYANCSYVDNLIGFVSDDAALEVDLYFTKKDDDYMALVAELLS